MGGGSRSCLIGKHLSVSLPESFQVKGKNQHRTIQSQAPDATSVLLRAAAPPGLVPSLGEFSWWKKLLWTKGPAFLQRRKVSSLFGNLPPHCIASEEVVRGGRWKGVGVGGWGPQARPRQLWCYKNVAAKQCGNGCLKHLINREAAVVISELVWKKKHKNKNKIQHCIQLLSRLQERSMGWK